MNLDLSVLPGAFAICRLDPDAPIPVWAQGDFVSISRTPDELSIVCRQDHVPGAIHAESGWRSLRVTGTLDFTQVGVISSLTTVLAEAKISVFVISSYDTDYLLVREQDLLKAVSALKVAGHRVTTE